MKKCPFCSAELEDNASFCLYCMKNFDEKKNIVVPLKKSTKKPWALFSIVAVIVVLLLLLFAFFGNFDFLFSKKSPEKADSESNFSEIYQTGDGDNSVYNVGSTPYSSGKGSFGDTAHNLLQNNSELLGEDASHSDDTVASYQSGLASVHSQSGSSNFTNINSQKASSEKPSSSGNSTTTSTTTTTPNATTTSTTNTTSTTTSTTTTSSKPAEVQKWEIKAVSGGVEITGIKVYEDSGKYVVPSIINGKTVVGIGAYAFKYESIKSIVLPDTIKYIGNSAFANISTLQSIIIPKNVTSIGDNAFMSCKNLSKVYIKSKNLALGNYVFSTMYQRDVDLTIYAPSGLVEYLRNNDMCDADYVEWNG